MKEFRMLSTSGILGYGYAEESLQIGMSWEPHVIGCDGGSTGPGPYYLGSGKSFTSRLSLKRDLRLMLLAATASGLPCIVATAGASQSAKINTAFATMQATVRDSGQNLL